MRFASRWVGGNPFWWDDWLHLASAILCVPLSYIATILWGVEMLLLKYSICCLYLRVFPNVWLKRGLFVFMAFTGCFVVPLLFTAAIRCNPVRAQWDLEAARTATCLDWLIILKMTVVYEVIAEIVLFALPIPIVAQLQMALAKKAQLMVFFGLGLVIIGVSIARVPFLKGVVDQSDQTYTIVGTSMSTFIASGLGHFCAAVPTVQALLRYVFNGFKHKTPAVSSGYIHGHSEESDGQEDYKSWEHSQNASHYSGETLQVSKQRSRKGSKDPYRRSTPHFSSFETEDGGALGDDQFMEMRPVKRTQLEEGGQAEASRVSEDYLSDTAILDV
ncbi:hypothetical protein ACEQ8H_008635, partial [Pleosporales sp. CAS-2024a]